MINNFEDNNKDAVSKKEKTGETNFLAEQDSMKIKDLIYTIRGEKVMVDRDLASLYEVGTKVLNQAVKRNIKRFPTEFRFQLTDEETSELVTNCDRFEMLKHSTSNPHCFTESGIAMLSSVLRSDVAIEVSIKIMKAFVEMRRFLSSNGELFARLDRVELKQLEISNRLSETDEKFEQVFDYIAEKSEVS